MVKSKLHILQQSPHDLMTTHRQEAEEAAPKTAHWVPSRFTARAVTPDGRMALWNTYRGSMIVLPPEQAGTMKALLSRKGFDGPLEGIAEYLYKRGFIVREGTNEFQRFQFDFGRRQYRPDVLELVFLASEDCNFRCTYCYENFSRGTMTPEARAGVKKYLESRIGDLKFLTIGWFGGEPLYGFEAFEDLAPFFLEQARKHGIGYHSHMTTNGYLLTPEVSKKLLAWQVTKYQITIDGPPEFHDRSRPTRTGEGSFEVIFENLKAMSRHPELFEVDIRVNFDQANYPHIDHLLDRIAREFGADSRFRLRFRPVGRWGGANDDNLKVCGLDEGQRITQELQTKASANGLSFHQSRRRGRHGKTNLFLRRRSIRRPIAAQEPGLHPAGCPFLDARYRGQHCHLQRCRRGSSPALALS